MRRKLAWPGALLLVLDVISTPAHALFEATTLDPAYCRQPTVRSTVLYIDDMVMVDGQTDWAVKVATKLRATLTPGERVTIVRLFPATGQSKEYWSACWPDFPAPQKAALAHETYFVQQNPVDRIAGQQKLFLRDFGARLTEIYLDNKRPVTETGIAAESPPPKQILRALASDEGRFTNSTVTIRAIIYSDLAENSDLGSVFHPAVTEPPGYGQKLGSYLRRGVFYAYGVGRDIRGDPSFLENARAFWTAALRSMAATVIGMGTDLNVPNTLPVDAYSWPVTLTFDGQILDGKLSLLVGEDGNLVDSWLGISRLGSAAISGTFRCAANRDNGCRLEAETSAGIATNAPSETLSLSGNARVMSGKLGVRGNNTIFSIKTIPPDG